MVEQLKTILWTWPQAQPRVYVGFPVEIRLVLENYTHTSYPKYDILVKVNSTDYIKETIALYSGARPFKRYHYTPTLPGIYEVLCNGQLARFEAVAMPGESRLLTIENRGTIQETSVNGVPIEVAYEASRETYHIEGTWGFDVFPGEKLTCAVRNDPAWRWQPILSIVPSPYDALGYWIINGVEKPSAMARYLPWTKPQSMIWVGMQKDSDIVVVGKPAQVAKPVKRWFKRW